MGAEHTPSAPKDEDLACNRSHVVQRGGCTAAPRLHIGRGCATV
jgi:hypothetical protein